MVKALETFAIHQGSKLNIFFVKILLFPVITYVITSKLAKKSIRICIPKKSYGYFSKNPKKSNCCQFFIGFLCQSLQLISFFFSLRTIITLIEYTNSYIHISIYKYIYTYICMYIYLLGKKSKLIRFFDSWGRNPVFQFSLEAFGKVGGILGLLEPSHEIDRVSTSDNSTPSGAY